MTARWVRRRGGRFGDRRAAMMLFMLLVGLPIIWLAGAISVDYTRILMGHRQAGQIADAASLAGTYQLVGNDPDRWAESSHTIDTARAGQVVQELIDRASSEAAGHQIRITGHEVVVSQPAEGRPAAVTVTVRYQVTDLLFLALVSNVAGASMQDGTISRTAIVCDPGFAPTFEGTCLKRP